MSKRMCSAVKTSIVNRLRAQSRAGRGLHYAWSQRIAVVTIAAVCALVSSGATSASAATRTAGNAPGLARPASGTLAPRAGSAASLAASIALTVGTPDTSEPSGEAPPSASALPGLSGSYVNDFGGTSLPSDWTAFDGPTLGDPGGQFGKAHVVVGGGLLQLNAWQDPAYNNKWVTGGVCQCGIARTYGAYFVRSRQTGPGPTQVEMLMPVVGWPPELDFNETRATDNATVATLHYDAADDQVYRRLSIDMTQWHTWGVIWTPTSITYTVDGRVWGTINASQEIPNQPMRLDISQQTWCSSGYACPTSPQSTQVDWVTEYAPSVGAATTVSPFAAKSAALSPSAKVKIVGLANQIVANGDSTIVLVGYSSNEGTAAQDLAKSRERAIAVKRYLRQTLINLHYSGVTITAIGKGSQNPVASNAVVSGQSKNRRVVPWIA